MGGTGEGLMSSQEPASLPARLPFAWWNTKIAPPSTSSTSTETDRNAAINVIQTLIQQQGCLVVALAEVRRQSVLTWIPPDVRKNWEVVEDTSGDLHDFDLAILFDQSRLVLMDHQWVRNYYKRHAVRAGLIATFGFTDDSGWLIVAAAHWRSDKGIADDSKARRMRAAAALHQAIVDRLRTLGSATPVLILGDFNAEPFDEPFKANLPTARSRDEVQRHRPREESDLLFYNAAWRWLGECYPWDCGERQSTLAGTYRLAGNRPDRWRTFDQVIVSPSLLGEASWSLDERFLGVFHDACVFDDEQGRPRPPFDHLPVVGHLRRPALQLKAK
jgi:hypothetical protein